MKPYVTTNIYKNIAHIEFFNPAHNALPSNLLFELKNAIENAGLNTNVRVIILKSGGDRTFCAGASFEELKNINTESEGNAFFMGFANLINALRKCPKFVIGRVQGKAVGGGVGIAAATDYCFATRASSIKLSELNLGIGPFVIEPALTRKLGIASVSELTLNPTNFFSADWAKEKGLFNEVFDTAESLDNALEPWTEKLSSYSPEAMQQIKKAFWSGTQNWDTLLAERAKISGNLVMSGFTKNILNNFN